MDEDVLKELAADELATQLKEEQKAAKKIRKEQDKVRQRIVAEKKAAQIKSSAKGGKGGVSAEKDDGNDEDEDVDDHDFQALASYSKTKKK